MPPRESLSFPGLGEPMTRQEILKRLKRTDELIKEAKEYAPDLVKENEDLKSKSEKLQIRIGQLEEEIQLAREENHQKTINALEEKEQRKKLVPLEQENKARSQELEYWLKKVEEQKKHDENINLQFNAEKVSFNQRKINLETKVANLHEFLKKEKKMTKERDEIMAKNTKYEQFAKSFESQFKKLDQQYKTHIKTNTLSKKEQRGERVEDRRLVEELAYRVDENLRLRKTDNAVIECNKKQISDLKSALTDLNKKIIIIPVANKKDALPELALEASTPPEVVSIVRPEKKIVKQKRRPQNITQRDLAEKEFFLLACLAVKLNNGCNIDEVMAISAEKLWMKASKQKVQIHQFHGWILDQINAMYFQTRFKKNAKKIQS